MASFLANTSAGEAFRQTDQRIVGNTVVGPPRLPTANFAIGPGGVSVLPNLPSVPAGAPAVSRISSRNNVSLEKNPRISLAYSVSQIDDNTVTQGDLVALSKCEDMWNFPKLLTVQEWMSRANDQCRTEAEFDNYFFSNTIVGVFATPMQSQLDHSSYGTDTVTINAARFCTIRDYWMCGCKAGDNLFIVARLNGSASGEIEDEPSAKRSKSTSNVVFYFVCAPNVDAAKQMADEEDEDLRGARTCIIRVGKAQNHIISVHGGADKMIKKYEDSHGDDFAYINDPSTRGTSRQREVHLDTLFYPHFV